MAARDTLLKLKEKFAGAIRRSDMPNEQRLFVYFDPASIVEVCKFVFRDLDARYVISIGSDDRPVSGHYLVIHDFAFDAAHLLLSVIAEVPAGEGGTGVPARSSGSTGEDARPTIASISHVVPAANWAEREIRDLVGVEFTGHPSPKRLVLPDGWPEHVHPLRKDFPWNEVPKDFDPDKTFNFDEPPEGCVVVPFGPFHPTLDEPAHFKLYVEGEIVRGCEYRGFMVHRGIEKLAESVLTYNEIPVMAERICGICGCVHNVCYAQAVEQAAGIPCTPRAEYIRTIMLEVERLHSHLLWVGLANHILGFDTMFMQAFRIREKIMWIAEKISGNRKTYSLCVIGGVRWEITPEHKRELLAILDKLEEEWKPVVDAVQFDKNIMKRTKGIGIATPQLVKEMGLIGPIARASGVAIDARRDHPYAAYAQTEFNVIVQNGCDVWSRVLVRALEVFESIKIIRQCLEKMPAGPLVTKIEAELPPGRMGVSSVEAPRGEAHHFVITGENNRPRRWRVRAPTYQNLQGVPMMIKDQQIADMTISLGSIDPCFSCTDRLEIVDIRTKQERVWTYDELVKRTRR